MYFDHGNNCCYGTMCYMPSIIKMEWSRNVASVLFFNLFAYMYECQRFALWFKFCHKICSQIVRVEFMLGVLKYVDCWDILYIGKHLLTTTTLLKYCYFWNFIKTFFFYVLYKFYYQMAMHSYLELFLKVFEMNCKTFKWRRG